MITPLSCCRMIKLTFQFGFCDESISGLAAFSHGKAIISCDICSHRFAMQSLSNFLHCKNEVLVQYAGDIQLASHLGRIVESLICEHPNEHSLRPSATYLSFTVKAFAEPMQSVPDFIQRGYSSAKIVGDVDNALLLAMSDVAVSTYVSPDLAALQENMRYYMHEAVSEQSVHGAQFSFWLPIPYMVSFCQKDKHKRINILRNMMSFFDAVTALRGDRHQPDLILSCDEIKSNQELYEISVRTKNGHHAHFVILNQCMVHFFFREHLLVVALAEKYRVHSGMNDGTRRAVDVYVFFYQGICKCLCF